MGEFVCSANNHSSSETSSRAQTGRLTDTNQVYTVTLAAHARQEYYGLASCACGVL